MSTENVAAAESEATEEPRVIEHKGVEYTIPDPLDFPLEVVYAENEVEIVRLVLEAHDEKQWKTYLATKPTIRDFQELSEKVNGTPGN
jgi:AAA+ superfamily predicted ATPase